MSEAQATVDHYATLGVAPRSEDVVIRAAYLALMRLHHPDKNNSSSSSERAQAINAAYAVLGDADKRLKYDWARRRAAEEFARRSRPRLTNVHYGSIAASVVALAVVALAFNQAPQSTDANAKPLRKLPAPAAFQSLPDSSNELPVAPVPEVVAPRSRPVGSLMAKPAAFADRGPPLDPKTETAPRDGDLRVRVLSASAPPKPHEGPTAGPRSKPIKPVTPVSRKCDSTKPGPDAAVCNNDNLAALDRLAATFYVQSLNAGNPAQRAALFDAHYGFLDRRKACRSEPCLRGAYLMHMRELTKIIESE